MIKIYYTIYFTTVTVGDNYEEQTGWKTITVYTIENDELKQWFDLESEIVNSSENEIQTWLDNNGYEDKEIEMILL